MLFEELRPNLHRWTARHPEWNPNATPDSTADWPELVGSVAYEAPDALAVVDPLVPDGGSRSAGDEQSADGEEEEEEAFWTTMDASAERCGSRVAVLTTIQFHRRSRDRFVERYGASTSRARESLPASVETLPLHGFGECLVWLPEHGALISGDRLVGDAEGGLRLCAESWLGYLKDSVTLDDLRTELQPLLELPIEMVIVSHGEPVLEGGRDALLRALD
jgi:hypothetical protein